MAGVPPIPPLVCNTPPPIDFGDEEDDSGLPPTLTFDDDDDFGDFALAAETNEDSTNADVSSLPRTPLQYELSSSTTSGFTDAPPVLEEYSTASPAPPPEIAAHAEPKVINNNAVAQPNEAFNYNVMVTNLQRNVFNSTAAKAVQSNGDFEIETSAPVATTSTLPVPTNMADNKLTTEPTRESNINAATESTQANDTQMSANATTKTVTTADISSANDSESVPNLALDENCNNAGTLYDNSFTDVILEDLADDSSDDECHRSPKKSATQSPKLVDEDSEEYFAIHVVDEPVEANSAKEAETNEVVSSNSCVNSNNDSPIDANSFDSVDFNGDANFNADFSQFANFQANMPATEEGECTDTTDVTKTNYNNNENEEASNNELSNVVNDAANPDDDADENDFDDFQDFASAEVAVASPPADIQAASPPKFEQNAIDMNATKRENSEENYVQAANEEEDEYDDDGFGDFEEASFAAPAAATFNTAVTAAQSSVSTQESLTPITPDTSNLQERFNTLLHMMFPASGKPQNVADKSGLNAENAAQRQASAADTLPLKSVETAKALEFQWPNSEMRHALIRAIGIDSRNILFGENWNPAMPRFAANLSFNPLKPIKPQSAHASGSNALSNAEMEAVQYSNGASSAENMPYITKSDVPEVEFDWQSAGLVNPLEGLKGEANTRETETIHTPPPGQLDASDDEHQSCSAYANVDDNFSEALSKDAELATATTTHTTNVNAKDLCTPVLPLDTGACTLTNEQECKALESHAKRALTPLHFSATIDDIEDETVVTSTYAGPLKETHIYTPSKSEVATSKTKTVSGSEPIDFDYEIAAAGIIIDETVVKKEYRDVEYNPGFSLEPVTVYAEQLAVSAAVNQSVVPATFPCDSIELESVEPPTAHTTTAYDCDEFTEFTEFQSVPPPPTPPISTPISSTTAASGPSNVIPSVFGVEPTPLAAATVSVSSPVPLAVTKTREQSRTPSRTSSPSVIDNMILSPAILLPQAIPICSNITAPTPSIEWGNSTANINPEELARIEELFPQPKISAATANDARKEATHSSQKSSPAHSLSGDGRRTDKNGQEINSLSISATVAQKEQDSSLSDDYWSDFVSVPMPQTDANHIKNNNNNNNNNNNHLLQTPKRALVNANVNVNSNTNATININSNTISTPRHRNKHFTAPVRAAATHHRANAALADSSANNCNDDDWSDFVSSTPASAHAPMSTPAAALGYMSAGRAPQFNSAAWQNANFYNNPIGLYHQTQQSAAATARANQQIHIMQDFSTMPAANRPQVANLMHNSGHNLRNNISVHAHAHSNHALQVGNARIAPSISLIPDLGFVAPAMPVHTAFVNVLPKPSYNGKK